MGNRYALVLTGQVLPGFTPKTVWPLLAAYAHVEPELLVQWVARAPLIIRQDVQLCKLKEWRAGITRTGAHSEICPPDSRAALFVLLEGTPRGPLPRVMVEQRVRQGLWADSIAVARDGSTEWTRYTQLDEPVSAPLDSQPGHVFQPFVSRWHPGSTETTSTVRAVPIEAHFTVSKSGPR